MRPARELPPPPAARSPQPTGPGAREIRGSHGASPLPCPPSVAGAGSGGGGGGGGSERRSLGCEKAGEKPSSPCFPPVGGGEPCLRASGLLRRCEGSGASVAPGRL